MKLTSYKSVIMAIFLVSVSQAGNAAVTTYPAPSGGIPASSDYTVTADGQSVAVYRVKVAPKFVGYQPCPSYYEPASMAYFDFSGTVNVRITSSFPISSVAIRPLRHGIQPTISGNTISFSLSNPANLSVEINGDDRHNLHLFANPMEINRPSPSDPNVIYYGPGVYGDGSIISIPSGKTVYVAGGAVIYGSMFTGSNVSVRGRGIVSGEKTTRMPCDNSGGTLLFHMEGGNASLEGIIALDTSSWNFGIRDVAYLAVDNIKAIAWRGNGDGIDFMSVSQALVKNVFIRSTDDIFAIKSNPYYVVQTGRRTENITIQDSVDWADGAGHSISLDELDDDYTRNIVFRNIDMVHAYTPVVSTGCCGSIGELFDVTLNDIRVEDMQGPSVFEIWGSGYYSVRQITINNFRILGGRIVPSTIHGGDANHLVSNVTFNNLNYLGQTILSPSAGQFQIGNYTSNITFTSDGTVPTPTPVPTPPPTPPGGTPSPDRTCVGPAASITDGSGNVWTLGSGSPYRMILRNGSIADGGYGSKIMFYQNTIYVIGDDDQWYRWTGTTWVYSGASAPSTCLAATPTPTPTPAPTPTPTPSPTVSPNRTCVAPAASITDGGGNVWTLGSGSPYRMILRNGSLAGEGYGSKIMFYQNTIYVIGDDDQWYRWTGTTWAYAGASAPSTCL